MMSLLQPAPEVFDLFDDIMLLRWVGRLPKATPQWAASTRRKFHKRTAAVIHLLSYSRRSTCVTGV